MKLAVNVIDPSLFTLPYDEHFVSALQEVGLDAVLIGRPLRKQEQAPEIPYADHYYKTSDGIPKKRHRFRVLAKGIEHCRDTVNLSGLKRGVPTISHFQWLPFPLVDVYGMRIARRYGPVIATVHDTSPFNGTPTSRLQLTGFIRALKLADKIVVHTPSGLEKLAASGIHKRKMVCIPHGPMGDFGTLPRPSKNKTAKIVLFGKLRPYKGVDVLINALARLSVQERQGLKVIIAGEPLMDLGAIEQEIEVNNLHDTVDLRLSFLDFPEMRTLFASADAFVFPYREIEASGVLYMVHSLKRWIIASDIGAFSETIADGLSGRLVPPENPDALAQALREFAKLRPQPVEPVSLTGWNEIARKTAGIYKEALDGWYADVGKSSAMTGAGALKDG
ncbi:MULTISPECIES: glycosyltransferase [unclassified Ruegeria]|uniref:glycosyltransferase n=1 Tax=unclassified Ruegeria TaxID=2625375 RepID=UPI0014899F87|nr:MULTISPECIES: glycosyltransferase [unclassified Ruegeria]